ncbi:transglutaminase-like domain-containing protein [Chengkuizengella axinellae]|uniref:Transglutaminase-like domain-containing protein n=1 Tax=Chengkuizengella axinellae TaxID=3064388 RepID=A0ABT9J069_9BACL|nr:transglutaminase-like domain-containing protein [Chengkuizengella sp. 2205SS18-9]MDP5274873.1 transglutaminase-like domain-containing protein [Chengkuizengella sp. 2205SS18-9]
MEPSVKSVSFSRDWITSGFICVILFILCWEWIYPLLVLSNFKNAFGVYPFAVSLGLYILIDYLRIPFILNWIIKICICWFLIIYVFYSADVFQYQAYEQFFKIMMQDINNTLDGKWYLWSSESRVFMFVLGWSIIISIIQSLMSRQHISGWFVTITIMYLFFLQLVFGMDTSNGIIRSLTVGLLSIALLHYVKMKLQPINTSPLQQNKRTMIWTVSVISIIVFIVSVGMILSKDKTKEIEALNLSGFYDYFKEMASSAQISGEYNWDENISLSGYGSNDSLLGGSVQLNHEVVFVGETEKRTYWRGESKSYYNGNGWIQPVNAPVQASEYEFEATIPTDTINQKILIENQNLGNILFSGGSINQFKGLVTSDGTIFSNESLMVDRYTEKYNIQNLHDKTLFYEMEVNVPNVESLMDQSKILKNEQIKLSNEELNMYLQLPETLPSRVKSLSQEITSGLSNPYKAALAIEQYLKENYEYNLQKSAIPAENEDFVDHFLFEQRLGYCDHFSTSMVVMLRSIDIPARWVKGFAPGELRSNELNEEGLKEYIVRNSDAHSWVEGFIEGIGWIPFEPTPSFTGHMDQQVATALDQSFSEYQFSSSPSTEPNRELQSYIVWLAAGLIFVGGLLMISFLSWRNELSLWYKMRKIDFSGNKRDILLKRYERYWVKIFHYFGAMNQGQSIREYVAALKLPKEEQNKALHEFAAIYESLRYSENTEQWVSRKKLTELWNKIMNK